MRYETQRTGRRGHPDSTTDALARGLGVFSIALGLMEVAAPRALARFLGMEGSEALIRGYEGDNPKKDNVTLALAAVAGVTALDVYCGQALSRESLVPLPPMRDYSDRSGLPRSPQAMRGAARRDFEPPRDFRTPEALRPWTSARPGDGAGRDQPA